MVNVRAAYESFLRERHRPAHARRTVESVAAFFVGHVRSGHRLVDLGCGPGSVTVGFAAAVGAGGMLLGVDLEPGPAPVPLVRGDIHRLPFPDRSFDAIFMCAVLQQVADPLGSLVEARRIARPGAVIGVADADWGGALITPEDPWLERGQEILTGLRAGTSPFVGRQLRGLLHAAGFVDVQVTARVPVAAVPAASAKRSSRRRSSMPAPSSTWSPSEDWHRPMRWPPSPRRGADGATTRRRPPPVTGSRPSPGSKPTDHDPTARLRASFRRAPGSSPIVATP